MLGPADKEGFVLRWEFPPQVAEAVNLDCLKTTAFRIIPTNPTFCRKSTNYLEKLLLNRGKSVGNAWESKTWIGRVRKSVTFAISHVSDINPRQSIAYTDTWLIADTG